MSVLYLTPLAAAHIGEKSYLRIQVKGGGCSGLRYIFSIEQAIKPNDLVFTQYDRSVVSDPLSLHFIQGSTVDYREELLSSHFVIINPQASNSCGCGDSFSI
jgi:iron-sulfur cluster assembly accessory protein